MQTQKIRIGNDIRLAVDLRQYIDLRDLGDLGYLKERQVYNPYDSGFVSKDSNEFVNKHTEVYYPDQYKDTPEVTNATKDYIKNFDPDGTPIGIRSIKAYIINTSKIQERQERLKKKSRFVSRFPIEPYMDCFDATAYDICQSGYPTYRAYPHHHMMMPYHGFGLHPEWGGIYKKLPKVNDVEYRAEVAATKNQNVVEISFPARAQLYTGMYKLVIVAQIYAPGFNNQNLKTITVDIPDVIQLVDTLEEGVDTGIKVHVGKVTDILGPVAEPLYVDNYVKNGSFDEDKINLSRTDGQTVSIDMSNYTAWHENEED